VVRGRTEEKVNQRRPRRGLGKQAQGFSRKKGKIQRPWELRSKNKGGLDIEKEKKSGGKKHNRGGTVGEIEGKKRGEKIRGNAWLSKNQVRKGKKRSESEMGVP